MSSLKGRRVVFRDRGTVDIEEFEVPKPRSDQILIKTICSLISPGTETAFLMALPNTPQKFPQYPGYSNVGVIEEIGEDVEGFRRGELVVSPTPHSSHVLARSDQVLRVPKGLSAEEAAFFNLASISLQGVRKGFIELGSSVVVVGQGLVGQLALQLARLSGGFPVIAVDLIDWRLEVSVKHGADYVINPSKVNVIEEVKRLTNGRGADVVIEATGNPNAIPMALEMARRLGRVVILGSPRGVSTVNFYTLVHRKGLIIIGAHTIIRPECESLPHYWTEKDDMKLILELIARGRLRVKDYISLRLPIEKASDAYKSLIMRKEGILGILLYY